MANAFITVKISGLDGLKDNLTKLAASMHDLFPAMELIGNRVSSYFAGEVFETQGSALGSQWASLKASTEVQKQAHYPGRGILERTGTLRKSFAYEAGPSQVLIKNTAVTRSGQSLFAIHQFGTSGGRGRGHGIPARPMMGINTHVEGLIAEVIRADIDEKIGRMRG
jgi:phage gpG-like protein